MKKITIIVLLGIATLFPPFGGLGRVFAQDMGLEFEASKKIAKGLEASVEGEVRTQDAFSDMERFSIGAGVQYKLASWLKADAGYLLMARRLEEYNSTNYNYEADWNPRHRAYVSLTGAWEPINHFQISLRERYQFTYATPVNRERYYLVEPERRASDKIVEDKGESILRSRLQVKYSRKKCNWEPFLSVEMLNDIDNSFANDQIRYTLGTDYKINKHNQVGLSYRYKDKSDNDEKKGHLITLSFSHAF